MSYTITERKASRINGEGVAEVVTIIVDELGDIPEPLDSWEVGSLCNVLAGGGKTYMLNNARTWEEVNFFGSGGSGTGGTPTPDVYTKSEIDAKLKAKVDTVKGQGLSANSYTDEEKQKVALLHNYDDTEIKAEIFTALSAVSTNTETLGYRRKNLFQNRVGSKSINGVTFTTNEDGTITLNGTATANAFYTMNSDFIVGDKPMILSGCPAGGSSNTYWLYILDGAASGAIAATDTGDGAVFSKSEVTTGIGVVRIRVAKGTVLDNLVFRPMIRYAAITDDAYEPYKPSVEERLTAIENLLTAQTSNGTTNFINAN